MNDEHFREGAVSTGTLGDTIKIEDGKIVLVEKK